MSKRPITLAPGMGFKKPEPVVPVEAAEPIVYASEDVLARFYKSLCLLVDRYAINRSALMREVAGSRDIHRYFGEYKPDTIPVSTLEATVALFGLTLDEFLAHAVQSSLEDSAVKKQLEAKRLLLNQAEKKRHARRVAQL